MESSEQNKIDNYILEKMDEPNRKAFEQEMAANKILADEVKLQQEAYAILDSVGDKKMKAQLDQIHSKVVGSKPSKFSLQKLLGILIGLLMLAGLAFYLLNPNAKPATVPPSSPDIIFAQYFEPYPLRLASRGDNPSLELQQAITLYGNQQYEVALPVFEKLISTSSDTQLRMAAGISALQAGDFDRALGQFDFLIDNQDSLYQDQARWYAAMTALKKGDSKLAQSYLNVLTNSDKGFKNKEARQILEEIK